MLDAVYSDRYLDYDFGPGHPFTPLRWEALHGLLTTLDLPLRWSEPADATDEEILGVHGLPFVEAVKYASAGHGPPLSPQFGLGTTDVPVFLGMHEATQSVCGGSIRAAKLILEERAARVLQLGGGLHHAMRERAAGFCVYNDVAMAIRVLLKGGMRVAFLDIDVHHADGVQQILYNEAGVLTISLHQSGRYLFPGTGFVQERGGPDAPESAINVPLQPGTGDESYVECFDAVVPDAVERFGPDVLVVEVGADAHFRDPLAQIALTTAAYKQLFDRIAEIAEKAAGGRLVVTLGGGYGFDATIRIWTMLALRLSEVQLPEYLPDDWVTEWSKRTGLEIQSELMDPEVSTALLERQTGAAIRNRQTVNELKVLTQDSV